LSGKRHPHLSRKDFPFNKISCGVCECKVLGEQKKQRYNYYHCTFSKGRHPGSSYVREEKLAEMLEVPVESITLPLTIADWLVEALEEKAKDASALQQNRLNTMQSQLQKAQDRLSKLYDLKIDGALPDEIFKAKESQYKAQIVELQAQIKGLGPLSPTRWSQGLKTLELTKTLHSQYKRANHHEKAQILRIIASNYTLQNETLRPTYKKPFNWLAEGLSCTDWLPD
jgi:site-specific DNA recombinase